MKKISLLSLVMLLSGLFMYSAAQDCTPDPTVEDPDGSGVSVPLPWADATQYEYYDEFITVIPPSSYQGMDVVYSVVFDSIVGLPQGMNWYKNEAEFLVTDPITRYCINIYGEPTESGEFPLVVYTTPYLDIWGTPSAGEQQVDYTSMSIFVNSGTNSPDSIITDEFCQGTTYTWNGSDYTTSGTYYYTTQSLVTGLDSLVQLNLIESPTYFIQEQHIICENEIYTWHGTDYSEPGTYTAEYSTVGSGCDSIYQLELTVNSVYEFVTSESICSGESFEWRGNTYTETDVYTETYYTAGSGCDSTYVLELTVNPLPQQVVVLSNPSNGILTSGNTGEINLSTSYTGTDYWVTMGAANFTGLISGNGTGLNLGSNYPVGTYDVWSRTDNGCELLQGSVTFIEDNGDNKLTANITFGTPATNFPAGEAEISLYKLTTDIGGEEVIVLDDQQTLGSNGQVVFENIEPGDYYLGSALINPDNYNVAEHVYYQTAITHENAISIPMTESTMFVADLHHPQLASEEGSNSGDGIVGEGGTKSDLSPLANMVVILRDNDAEEIIDVCVTNANGEYNFPNIPDNTNIEVYVTSLEHQNWTPYSILTETDTHLSIDFVVNGDEVYPDGTVGTDVQFASDVNIYPNPTNGIFSVTGSDLQQITITDLNGKIILEQSVNGNKANIDLSGNSKAIYLIKVESAKGTRVEKIVFK